MPKINQEEYEILKGLDDKWKWIARGEDGEMYTFVIKPHKNDRFNDWRNRGCDWIRFENSLLQFIQWEDEEPHNIQELIEEYEDSKEYKDSLVIEYFMDKAKESEETEVKKVVNLSVSFDRGLETYPKMSIDEAIETLTDYGTKYSVVKKEPETVADVIADFFKSLERLKEVMSMEIEELEE